MLNFDKVTVNEKDFPLTERLFEREDKNVMLEITVGSTDMEPLVFTVSYLDVIIKEAGMEYALELFSDCAKPIIEEEISKHIG